jgi:hypothetical protein
MKKKLNLILDNGLCIINAKIRESTPLITLFITDYTNNTRVLFDVENKRILANKDNIELTGKDVENILLVLKEEPKKAQTKT